MIIKGTVATLYRSTILPVLMGGYVKKDGAPQMELRGRGNIAGHIPLVVNRRGQLPTWGNDGIVQASPVFDDRGRLSAISGYHDATDGLLVIVPGISFASTGLPVPRRLTSPRHSPHHLLWPSGEGVDVANCTFGDRRDPGQVQIFGFRDGEHILAVDEDERLVVVLFASGSFGVARASEQDLIDHVVGRSERVGVKYPELEWCCHVLYSMGRADLVLPIKEKIIRLFPGRALRL